MPKYYYTADSGETIETTDMSTLPKNQVVSVIADRAIDATLGCGLGAPIPANSLVIAADHFDYGNSVRLLFYVEPDEEVIRSAIQRKAKELSGSRRFI